MFGRKRKKDHPVSIDNLLDTNLRTGLSEAEARRRLEIFGPNEIPEKEPSFWVRLFKRFWGPIPWMIEIAAILSALVQKWEDFAIIVTLLLVNAYIDFRQESKAISALKVLKQKLSKTALALREGKWKIIPARELVPGDVVKLKIGDIVPADVQLKEGDYLLLDLSALTGESLPVEKKPGDLAYSNAVVKAGEMTGVVTATGLNTYFGKTVALVAKAEREERSHFQQAVMTIANFLIAVTIVLALAILAAAYRRHDPMLEMVRFTLVLVVASIPVALPAVLSVTMAAGALRMARRNAVVSRLAAIEEMAGMDILCSDKTGTLTQNRMEITEPVTFHVYQLEDLLLYAALASREENQDPLEVPIFRKLEEMGLRNRLTAWKQLDFIPFDPIRKRTEARVERSGERLRVVKGAPQVIFSLCEQVNHHEEVLEQAQEKVEAFAEKGYRTIAVAISRDDGETYELVGLIPFYDPPREDSAPTIAEARRMGVDVKMVTGDNVAIARQIARMLGIEGEVYDIKEFHAGVEHELFLVAQILTETLYAELKPDASDKEIRRAARKVLQRLEDVLVKTEAQRELVRKHESEIIALIERAGGFAQVFPEDKYFIVEELQKGGHIVGMTGDGVNDAPALRKADAGIAVAGATDAARAAADVVLLEPGLSVIIDGIKVARRTFERMKAYTIYRINETIRLILFLTLAITVFNFYPVTAIMIIILALLNDIPILAIATDNVKLAQRPVRWNFIEVLGIASLMGVLGLVSSFLVLFALVHYFHYSMEFIRSAIFLKLVIAGHTTIFITRSYDRFLWTRPFPSWQLLAANLSTGVIGVLMAVYGWFMVPVGWDFALFFIGYYFVWMLLIDAVKVWAYRVMRRRGWV
ncbi:H+-transporting ATPase [Methylomarinovum tepidoasis]|uniref:H+-transporting ATPase n=1 Tax=Methylomarinovum tepidoasis TaxID=2840183 RepID=A0AAU9C0Q9_9GAMM|nr:plasma-membrane proton-efflux P-type ATPase [Methylomarinovum sp. IN45]BCX89675.1 H+-transporting ATPase [Methylomarinovum sp. IN45]